MNEALRLADELDKTLDFQNRAWSAAKELRRLDAMEQHHKAVNGRLHIDIDRLQVVNKVLLGALRVVVRDLEAVNASGQYGIELEPSLYQANAAIAKATGEPT